MYRERIEGKIIMECLEAPADSSPTFATFQIATFIEHEIIFTKFMKNILNNANFSSMKRFILN